jgi:hypothetical protein
VICGCQFGTSPKTTAFEKELAVEEEQELERYKELTGVCKEYEDAIKHYENKIEEIRKEIKTMEELILYKKNAMEEKQKLVTSSKSKQENLQVRSK